MLGWVLGVIYCVGVFIILFLCVFCLGCLEEMLCVNVVGVLELICLLCKLVYFSKEGGSIIFLFFVMGVVGEKGKFMYSVSKGVLVVVVKFLVLELVLC